MTPAHQKHQLFITPDNTAGMSKFAYNQVKKIERESGLASSDIIKLFCDFNQSSLRTLFQPPPGYEGGEALKIPDKGIVILDEIDKCAKDAILPFQKWLVKILDEGDHTVIITTTQQGARQFYEEADNATKARLRLHFNMHIEKIITPDTMASPFKNGINESIPVMPRIKIKIPVMS